MLENLTFTTAIATLGLASSIKSVPFKLKAASASHKVLVLEAVRKRRDILLWYLATFTTFSHGIFQIISFICNVWTNGLTKDSAPHFLFLTNSLFAILFYGNLFWKPNETIHHVNCISILMEQSKKFRSFFYFSGGY